jgi:hypothetical protein|tara:strand:+ start:249 stop:1529 length:1281 start_codon:yes stop_codon:yes gene_type:complete
MKSFIYLPYLGVYVVMSVLEVNLAFFDIYHSFADTLLVSFQHAFFLALPFSPPLLISLRRVLIEDFRSGVASYLGTTFGYTLFLALLLFGFRQLIQFWYDWEPAFFIIGIILSIKLLISFYNESVYKDDLPTTLTRSNPQLISIALIQVGLVFCNPVNLFHTPQFLISNELLGFTSPFLYLFCFFISFLFVSLGSGIVICFCRDTLTAIPAKFTRRANQLIVITSLSLIFAVTTKKTWHLVFYPLENVYTGLQNAGSFLPFDFSKIDGLRKFIVFDTNIRERDRNLSVLRHFPMETLKQRRVWANKEPFTEIQMKDLYFRFHVHSINRLGDLIQKTKVTQRTPFLARNSKEQLEHLIEIQDSYQDLKKQRNFIPGILQNQGKGLPFESYIEKKQYMPRPTNYFHPKSEVYKMLREMDSDRVDYSPK